MNKKFKIIRNFFIVFIIIFIIGFIYFGIVACINDDKIVNNYQQDVDITNINFYSINAARYIDNETTTNVGKVITSKGDAVKFIDKYYYLAEQGKVDIYNLTDDAYQDKALKTIDSLDFEEYDYIAFILSGGKEVTGISSEVETSGTGSHIFKEDILKLNVKVIDYNYDVMYEQEPYHVIYFARIDKDLFNSNTNVEITTDAEYSIQQNSEYSNETTIVNAYNLELVNKVNN